MASDYERALELEGMALVGRNNAFATLKAAEARARVAHDAWLRYRRASKNLQPRQVTEGEEG